MLRLEQRHLRKYADAEARSRDWQAEQQPFYEAKPAKLFMKCGEKRYSKASLRTDKVAYHSGAG